MDRLCEHCGRSYDAQSPRAKFCKTPSCVRERDAIRQRRKKAGGSVVALRPDRGQALDGRVAGPLEVAARVELEAAGQLESLAGQNAVAVARRMDAASSDTGSSYAALSKELRAAMGEALKDAPRVADAFDELRARRLARHA